jgi:phage N-6-adenine-methyltransferase
LPEPKHNKGSSKQDYGTPPELLAAIKSQLDINGFGIDLAATKENAVAPHYLDETIDSLSCEWVSEQWMWCNPPYSKITPWVKKASESNARIAMLLPASVGSNWWRDYVHEIAAEVWFLNGRVKFVGAPTHSPKDHVVIIYRPTMVPTQYKVWSWSK